MNKSVQGDYPRRNWTPKGGQTNVDGAAATANIGNRDDAKHDFYKKTINDAKSGPTSNQRIKKSPRSKK